MHLNAVYTAPANNTQCSSPNAHWTEALRGLEGEERLQGGRREEGKGMLTRALCTAVCDRPARGWEPEDRAACIWPARSFWKFKRFYTQIKISGLSWEIIGIGHPQSAFLRGKTIGWKMRSSCPFKAGVLSSWNQPSRPTHWPIIVLHPAKITHFCYQLGLCRHVSWWLLV